MSNIPSLTLNTNASMPLLGLGVYKATAPGEVEGAIATALDLGYRLIDTASAYKNEEGVGRGIRSSSVPRKELFITTKLWNTAQRIGDIDGAFQRSLDRLGLDYVDSLSDPLAGTRLFYQFLAGAGAYPGIRSGQKRLA